MVAPSQSIAVPPTVRARAVEVRRPLALVVAHHAMPLVAAAAGTALATLAVERAVAGLALRGLDRLGLTQARSRAIGAAPIVPLTDLPVTRVTVTRITVVERITRRA